MILVGDLMDKINNYVTHLDQEKAKEGKDFKTEPYIEQNVIKNPKFKEY